MLVVLMDALYNMMHLPTWMHLPIAYNAFNKCHLLRVFGVLFDYSLTVNISKTNKPSQNIQSDIGTLYSPH